MTNWLNVKFVMVADLRDVFQPLRMFSTQDGATQYFASKRFKGANDAYAYPRQTEAQPTRRRVYMGME